MQLVRQGGRWSWVREGSRTVLRRRRSLPAAQRRVCVVAGLGVSGARRASDSWEILRRARRTRGFIRVTAGGVVAFAFIFFAFVVY